MPQENKPKCHGEGLVIEERDGAVVLRFSDDLFQNPDRVYKVLVDICGRVRNHNWDWLILDFEYKEHTSSAVIGAIAFIKRDVGENDVVFQVVGITETLRQALRFAALEKEIAIFKSLDQGIEAVQARPFMFSNGIPEDRPTPKRTPPRQRKENVEETVYPLRFDVLAQINPDGVESTNANPSTECAGY